MTTARQRTTPRDRDAHRDVLGSDTVDIAVDLGGSSVRACDARNPDVVARRPVGAAHDTDQLVDLIVDVIDQAAASRSIGRVVVSIPSFVMADGTFGPCPQLPNLAGTDLDHRLATRTDAASVSLVPDVAAGALAEQKFGTGQASHRFVCVVIGTGVNAAAVIDGELAALTYGCLGDAGHVKVTTDGPACPCGGLGCLEALCSGFALARDGRDRGYPSAHAVLVAALNGEPEAVSLVTIAGTALGRALATWTAMLWPDTIAVAGGLSVAGDLLIGPAVAELRRVGTPYIIDELSVTVADLSSSAPLYGAAIVAQQR